MELQAFCVQKACNSGCIIHQIRYYLKYVGSKYQKEFISDLKKVYKASTKTAAEEALDELSKKWGEKLPMVYNVPLDSNRIFEIFISFKNFIPTCVCII